MIAADRRRVLVACGGALTIPITGCLDGVLDSSAGGSAGDGSVPDAARWFPAPAAFGRDVYGAFSVDVSAFLDRSSSLSPALTTELSELSSFPWIDDPEQIASLHLVGNRTTVATGDLDEDAVIGFYEGEGFERVGTREGFTLLEGSLGFARSDRIFAIREGAMIATNPASSDDDRPLRPVAEAVVDAETGTGERYHDVNDSFRRLLEALPAGDTISGAAGPPEQTPNGFLANGTASTVGSSTTDLEAVVRFREDAVEEDGSLADAAASSEFFRGAEVDTTIEDDTLRATASVPTEELERVPLGLL